MVVHVYRHHSRTCPHRKNRFWKKCDCLVWLQWNHKGKQFRQPTHSSKWEVASKMARNIEADYEASGTRTPKPVEPITIESAVTKFLADREAQQLRPATVSKLRTIFENQFLMWCCRAARSLSARRDAACTSRLADVVDRRPTGIKEEAGARARFLPFLYAESLDRRASRTGFVSYQS
jgi:hypothetical protein